MLYGYMIIGSLCFMLGGYLVYRDHKKAMRDLIEFYRDEIKAIREARPLVQHCNSRTDYEFIKHRYDPEWCKHCKEVQELLNEM